MDQVRADQVGEAQEGHSMKQKTVDAARGKWHSVLAALGIDQAFLRNRHGPCPMCGGVDRFRFDDKNGDGTWYCNGCGSGRGIELVMRLRGVEYKQACTDVDAVVGNAQTMTTRGRKGDPSKVIKALLQNSDKTVEGDAVANYLHARGLILPAGLRTYASAPFWTDGQRSGSYPAMVARLWGPDDELTTVHVTYISGTGKAPVSSPRKLQAALDGRKTAGSAVRLFNRAETMAIAEGIETAIAYQMLTGTPCWAATNALLLSQWQPPEGVKTVVIAGDNDANYVGQHHSYALADRLTRAKFQVFVDLPPLADTDWCDHLQKHKISVDRYTA